MRPNTKHGLLGLMSLGLLHVNAEGSAADI